MSKIKFITLAASIMLALAFTLSCSDDKDDPPPSYLSCTELQSLLEGGFMGGNPDAYMDNLASRCQVEHMSELQQCTNRECGENIVFKCMANDENVRKLCGGNSLEACGKHYDDTCKE
jgi:hypothetical protein